MMPKFLLFLFIASLSSCGGSESNEKLDQDNTTVTINNFDYEVQDSLLTLTWEAEPEADKYNVYYSTESGFDVTNYAAYESAQLIPTDSETASLEIDRSQNHFVFIEALKENDVVGVSGPNVLFTFLQASSADSAIVLDYLNDREWKRCSNGQTWDEASSNCIGSPSSYEAKEAYDLFAASDENGWSLPIYEGSNCGSARIYPLITLGSCGNSLVSYKKECVSYIDSFFPNRSTEPYYQKVPPVCSSSIICKSSFTNGQQSGFSTGCAVFEAFDGKKGAVLMVRRP